MSNRKPSGKRPNTEAVVREIILPTVTELGYELWDVRFQKEGTEHYLRITIDSANGIQIEDCEVVSRAIDPILDQADPIDCGYYLEVSSPGLGRPLTRDEHFAAMMGEEVRVHLIRPVDDSLSRDYVGTLSGYNGDVTLGLESGEQMTFEKGNISSVKLNDDADLF